MSYALIPEGFELKKVTKLQKDAVDEYFGKERRGTYFSEFLGNETTPLLIGGAALLVALPLLTKLFFDSLDLEKIILSDEQKLRIERGFRAALIASPFIAPFVIGKEGLDVAGEVWEKYGP